MKNIEQILSDTGIEVTDEQKAAITKAVAENYKTIAEHEKLAKKVEGIEAEKANLKEQLETANSTLEKFKDIDPEKTATEIENYKKQIADAEAKAQAQITERDQRDYLKAEFDKLGITSERTRRSLMADIMGEDGLKWKDNAFMGLSDYLTKENEKDHFYQTEEEKEEAEKKADAEKKAPKFTDKSEPKSGNIEAKKTAPVIF
jgi:hypothetical protein